MRVGKVAKILINIDGELILKLDPIAFSESDNIVEHSNIYIKETETNKYNVTIGFENKGNVLQDVSFHGSITDILGNVIDL